MADNITIRIPRKLSVVEVHAVPQKKKKNRNCSTTLKNKTKKIPDSLECSHDEDTFQHDNINDDITFPEEGLIHIDPLDTYIIELKKIYGLMVKHNSKTFALPDLDLKTHKLIIPKVIVVKRRKVFLQKDESESWLYSCYCNKSTMDLIDSMPDIILEPIEDQCLHVSVVKLADLENMEDRNEYEDGNHQNDQGAQSTEITFCPNKQLVTIDGDAGVVSYEYGRLKCFICDNTYCKHVSFIKESGQHIPETTFELKTKDSNVFSCRRLSVFLNNEQKSILSAKIDDTFSKRTILGKTMFYAIEEFGERCVDCECLFDYTFECNSYTIKHILTRNEIIPCAVYDLDCPVCNLQYCFEGSNKCVLHYGNYLIHHSVLRDYMFHFLNGNSCTLHGFYDIWKQHQDDNGNAELFRHFRYDMWRKCWYVFLDLLDITLDSSVTEEAFQCPKCGPEPNLIVCDATSLGFQKKYSCIAFPDTTHEEEVFPRTSEHSERIAISNKPTRDLLKKWCAKETNARELYALKQKLADYSEIYEAFMWTLTSFPGGSIPKGIIKFFNCLAQSSPVCSYVFPSETTYDLCNKLFAKDVKTDLKILKVIREKLPIYYQVLIELFEPKLPLEWKPLVWYLVKKSKQPFISGSCIPHIPKEKENVMSFFPSLPSHRGRGKYVIDQTNCEQQCNKYYRGHPNLTSGIFTLYCHHGKVKDFQIP